jgi:hypothetical protein
MVILLIFVNLPWSMVLEMLGVGLTLPYLLEVGELYYVFYVLYHLSGYYIAFYYQFNDTYNLIITYK